MRLLPKSEVDLAKARDRQREVEEGKKLASRVDSLRELSSEEELRVSELRDKLLTELGIEVGSLIKQKEDLNSEIQELLESKRISKIPLEREWYELKQKIHEVEKLQDALDAKHLDISRWETKVITREADLETRLSDVLHLETTVNSKSKELRQAQRSLDKSLEESRKEVEANIESTKRRTEYLNSRELELGIEIQNFKVRENLLNDRERTLNERESVILEKEFIYNSPVKKFTTERKL